MFLHSLEQDWQVFMLTYLLIGQIKEEHHNQMNYHTLSGFHRKNQKRFLPLIALSILVFAGFSNSFAQEDQSINLTTNKNSYLPGEVVEINGTANGQPGQLVAIQIKDSSGNLILIRTVQADQN